MLDADRSKCPRGSNRRREGSGFVSGNGGASCPTAYVLEFRIRSIRLKTIFLFFFLEFSNEEITVSILKISPSFRATLYTRGRIIVVTDARSPPPPPAAESFSGFDDRRRRREALVHITARSTVLNNNRNSNNNDGV